MNRDIPATTVEKWRKLLQLIFTLTENDHLTWRETAIDDEFITSFNDAVIVIAKKKRVSDEGFRHVIEIRLQDVDGKEIDSFDDEDLSEEFGSAEYYVVMKEFMKKLQRKLSGAEQVIDTLIRAMQDKSLDDEIPF